MLNRKLPGQIDPNITIVASTTRKVLRDNHYTARDDTNVRPIVRKRHLQRNLLTEKHLRLRESYCDQVDRWFKEVILQHRSWHHVTYKTDQCEEAAEIDMDL